MLAPVEQYICELLSMDPKVSSSLQVITFLQMNQQDNKFVDIERSLRTFSNVQVLRAGHCPVDMSFISPNSQPHLRRCRAAASHDERAAARHTADRQ